MLFNAASLSSASSFPFAEWMEESTSGNHATVATGTNIYDSLGNQTSDVLKFELADDRVLYLYQNSSQYPTAQIFDPVSETAGTAQTILSSATGIMFGKKVPGKNAAIVGINNDLYYVDAGSSGTTVTVTQISTDAGDSGRAEAFGLCRTDIDIADDASCFVVSNTYNNAGTYRYVFALWTLNTSTPSCTYVTRSAATATGDAANFVFGETKKTATAKQFAYFGGVNGDTDLRVALVDYTTSSVTITDTDSSTISGGFNGSNGLDHKGLSLNMDGNNAMIGIFKGGSTFIFMPIKFLSNNISFGTQVSRASFLNAGQHRHLQPTPATHARIGQPIESTAIRLQLGIAGVDTGYVNTDQLIGSLTSVVVYASAKSADGRTLSALGKTSTNTGQFFVLKLD